MSGLSRAMPNLGRRVGLRLLRARLHCGCQGHKGDVRAASSWSMATTAGGGSVGLSSRGGGGEEGRWQPGAGPITAWAAGAAALVALGQQDSQPSECKAPARNIHDFYKIVEKPIGTGGFGAVFTGIHRETGEVVAIKQLPKRNVRPSKVMEEIDILRVAGEHRNIIGFKDLFSNEDYFFIVMDLAQGGELFDRLVQQGAYSEQQASRVMREIIEAVTYLHQQGIVHCDIKPENIMMAFRGEDDCNMRLVDFGSAARIQEGKPLYRKGSGTVGYSAPEVLKGEPCSAKADVFSLGVVMYILLSGYHPFDPLNNADDHEVAKRIIGGNFVTFDTPVWDRVSPLAKDLLMKLLSSNEGGRPSAPELLHHPWIAGNTDLSNEPLAESAENLRRFQRGRRRLKALMLAVMAGLANEEEQQELPKVRKETGTIRPRDSPQVPAEFLGSRRAAIRSLDPYNKGYITLEDVKRTLASLGEELSESEMIEMLKSGDGDPNTKSQVVTHQQLYKLLPPLCPSKVVKRGELFYGEGDVDNTYYLLQKGEVLLRFSSFRDGIKRETAVEPLRMGDSFGEVEMLLKPEGGAMPRTMACECLSPRCEVIAIEDFLFSLLTDVYGSVNVKLREKAERRCRRLVNAWAEDPNHGIKRTIPSKKVVWSADQLRKEGHKLFLIKKGFVEVEYRPHHVHASSGGRIFKRFGPGTYLHTEDKMFCKTECREEHCTQVRTMTDSEIVEVPSRVYHEFLRNSRKQAIMNLIFEVQEEKGNVVTVKTWQGDVEDGVSNTRRREKGAGPRFVTASVH